MNQKEDLVDWTDNQLKELSKDLGLELQMIDNPTKKKHGTSPISGEITFLKGDSAKKAEELFHKKDDKVTGQEISECK